MDQGAEAQGPRWQAKNESFQTLQQVLATTTEPLVILGAPGCGKSTLLRHYELENAQAGLTELAQSGDTQPQLTFFIQLNDFKGARHGDPLPTPLAWLTKRWAQRNPDLPDLTALLKTGQMTLLLDALNEIPYRNAEVIQLWKDFLSELEAFHGATRVIFSCRSLDYSAPLSSKDRPVPQVRIESLSDDKVRDFLRKYSPHYAETLWNNLKNTAQLNVFRSPYFLNMLIKQSIHGNIPDGRAALFTAFVRQLIKREIDGRHPLFQAGELLQEADIKWLIQPCVSDKITCELPEHGILIPKLSEMAFRMQLQRKTTESGQVKTNYDQALVLLNHPLGDEIINAGVAMDILEKEPGSKQDQVFYLHQLIQEYFAARWFTETPQLSKAQSLKNKLGQLLNLTMVELPTPQLAKREWLANRVSPKLTETLNTLPDSDPLPPLPATGWEETLVLASAMLANADNFITQLMEANLALAGRCAAQPDVNLSGKLKEKLQWTLVKRTQNRKADLRARIAAGFSLGELGDPRFQKKQGPEGVFLLPPLLAIPGGVYTLGSDEGLNEDEAHPVTLDAFQLGRFPVTNAEWQLFMEAGGYDDERWWKTEAAKAWQRGENTSEGPKLQWREDRKNCQDNFANIREWQRQGKITSKQADDSEQIAQMTDAAFEEALATSFPGGQLTEPALWHDDAFNRAAQPVAGICWYEALAYCNWLGNQSSLPFRLPSEAEWEAAARGFPARRYAYGNTFNVELANTFKSRIRATTPIGIFPGGNTPEGLEDMTGNVWEWTSSAYQDYPYNSNDGRENPQSDGRRVLRGGSWGLSQDNARAASRFHNTPDSRNFYVGFRVVCSSPIVHPPSKAQEWR
jgi:formylglycine-generating enzyme required for sulfatase activity